jgi:hypothetical protein
MNELLTTSPPWLYLTTAAASEIDEIVQALSAHHNHTAAIRKLRGEKMRTHEGIWDEFTAALQLPTYFGRNWDALDECLHDLSWLNADAYVLVFSHADQLLFDDDRDFPILLKVLNQCGLSWSRARTERGQPARPFNSLFASSSPAQEAEFERRALAAGLPRTALHRIRRALAKS